MVSSDLEKSLRDAIGRHLDERLSGLQAEVARLQTQLNDALASFAERLGETNGAKAEVASAVSEHLHTAYTQGIEEAAAKSARARASSDVALIKAAIDDIDSQRTQTDILNALVNRAASFAPRIAFFIIKNNRATGWRARGLEGTVGDEAVREISLPLEARTLLSEVVESKQTWSGAGGANKEDEQIYGRLGAATSPERLVAIPLVARNKTVAALYADSADLDSDAINLEALETMVCVAGMAVELLATQRPLPTDRRTPPAPQPFMAPSPSVAPAPSHASTQPFTQMPPLPSSLQPADDFNASSATVEPPPVPSFADFTPPAETASVTTGALDAETPSFPSPSSFAEPPSFAESQQANVSVPEGFGAADRDVDSDVKSDAPEAADVSSPLGAARQYGGSGAAGADLPVEVANDGEKRLHTDARRFARLLVSEIKLYNEQKVREGRASGDIYPRLREEIDRSREMYDKRVRPEVAVRYDYFHTEVVNTLAEGDVAKLGDGYPGATVS